MRKTGICFILLFLINVYIGLNRNNGFEYIETLTIKELYPAECDKPCITKWTNVGSYFTTYELEQGLSFLNKEIGFDTINTTEKKIILIASYLFNKFQNQMGIPSKLLNTLRPLQQLQLLVSDTSEQIWCGNFQFLFNFLCTSANLPNRLVEIVAYPDTPQGDVHEVNEVYLENQKKWIMVDVTRNMLLIYKENLPVSLAEYLNFNLFTKTGSVHILKSATAKSFIFDTVFAGKKPQDLFFNSNFFLRYYYMTDLEKVYNPLRKIQRYILADPWYAVYDPQKKFSDFRFRIKQFFILLLSISLTLFLFLFVKNKIFNK